MSELAWTSDARGRLLWGNPMFLRCLGAGALSERFLARWQRTAAPSALIPARDLAGRTRWLATRFETLIQEGVASCGGFAADVTEAIEARLELSRLGPLRETPGPAVLALDRVVVAMAERVGGLLSPGRVTLRVDEPRPRLHAIGDPQALERALLDLALLCAGAPDPAVLRIALATGARGDHAVLSLIHQADRVVSPLESAELPPMLAALRDSGVGIEAAAGGVRLLLPLYRPPGAEAGGVAARILVVDDEEVVRMLVVDLLRERGHAVQEAQDAFAAMAMLQEGEALDLMITDIGLPGGFDGSTLARRTRQLRPDLPILFITGYAFGTNNDVTLEPGIPVLTKPFTLGALAARIADLLPAVERVGAAIGPGQSGD